MKRKFAFGIVVVFALAFVVASVFAQQPDPESKITQKLNKTIERHIEARHELATAFQGLADEMRQIADYASRPGNGASEFDIASQRLVALGDKIDNVERLAIDDEKAAKELDLSILEAVAYFKANGLSSEEASAKLRAIGSTTRDADNKAEDKLALAQMSFLHQRERLMSSVKK